MTSVMPSPLSEGGGARLVTGGRCRRLDGCSHQGSANELWLGDTLLVRGLCDGCIGDLDREEARLRRETARAELLFGATERMRGWTLATYPGPESALMEVSRWLEEWRAGERRNLVLFGPVGSGKTGLAWSLGLELATHDGVEVVLRNWRDTLADLRESFDGGRGPDIGKLRRCELLILDDLGAEQPTAWARNELAELIEARYGARLPVVVTSNYPLGALGDRLGHDDQTIGHRIVSRINEDAVKVRVEGQDLRTPTKP